MAEFNRAEFNRPSSNRTSSNRTGHKATLGNPVLAWAAMAAGFLMFLVFMLPQLWTPVTPGLAGLRLAVLLIGLAVFAAGLASYNRWSLDNRKSIIEGLPSTSAPLVQADDYEPYSPGTEASHPQPGDQTNRMGQERPENRP